MLNINTNLSSLIAQNSLNQSTNKLNTAIERMSTGCKINHAKDNAANYSISTNMTTKIGAYQVAEDNALQGLDMINTASESLTLIEDKLMRLRALAEQSANGTYGTQSKQAINQEANAIVDEIERLYNTTEYNGINLAKGNVIGTEESKFIKDIDRRDTSKMTTLASVAIDKALTSGTYSISTADELAKLATMTNNGLIGAGCEFVLGADIDLSGYSNWTPIGIDISLPDGTRDYSKVFTAVFDGNGYEISNLKINSSEKFRGLLGFAYHCVIKNVGLENVVISDAGTYSGGLVGDAQYSDISNCYANVDINATSGGEIGGLAGLVTSRTNLENCYAVGEVNSTRESIGGLVAQLNDMSTIKTSYANVVVKGSSKVGGLIGSFRCSSVYDSYSLGNVVASNGYSGSLIGCISAVASNINVNTLSNGELVIDNCYATGSVVNNQGISSIIGLLSYKIPTEIKIKDLYYKDEIFAKISNTNIVTPILENVEKIDANTTLFQINNVSKNYNYDSQLSLQVGVNSDISSSISCEIGNIDLSKISILRKLAIANKSNLDYISLVDSMLKSLSKADVSMGAVQNRLESVVEEIGIQYDNLVSSRSTLRDADIAEVSAEYIQQQILQQASATLMATANQSASIALSLI